MPPHIGASHRRALENVSAELAAEFGPQLLGLLVGGSVGAGTATAGSDLDLFALVDARVPPARRRRTSVDGVAIDTFLELPNRALTSVAQRRSRVLVENYASGAIVFDPSGLVKAICEQAQLGYDRGRRPAKPGELFAARAGCQDICDVLVTAVEADDTATVDYAAALLAARAVETYYLVRARWDPPPKRRMAQLRDEDPAFCAALREMLATDAPTGSRADAAARLLRLTFVER
jgi:hypothetical protein